MPGPGRREGEGEGRGGERGGVPNPQRKHTNGPEYRLWLRQGQQFGFLIKNSKFVNKVRPVIFREPVNFVTFGGKLRFEVTSSRF